jgi:hypothetical protein
MKIFAGLKSQQEPSTFSFRETETEGGHGESLLRMHRALKKPDAKKAPPKLGLTIA